MNMMKIAKYATSSLSQQTFFSVLVTNMLRHYLLCCIAFDFREPAHGPHEIRGGGVPGPKNPLYATVLHI